jgi:DNA uptake protein ComE-like DNA-binding protein
MSFKSHFEVSKQQRNGIFLLLLLIIIIQGVYYFVDFSSEDIQINQNELEIYRQEVDSLRLIEIENSKPKRYPVNPNDITDYKGEVLGMTSKEVDRLHAYRKQNKWVNSAKQFQQVTKVSDSLLAIISPFFKFPDWVTQQKPKKTFFNSANTKKSASEKLDLNTATQAQLQKVYGVGEKLSQRIIDYRDKQNGFVSLVELQDVYGLSPETILNIKDHFLLKTPRVIKKLNLNTATQDELVTIKYIDYEVAHNIIEQRTLKEGFASFDELLKIQDFPIKKIDIITLYLALN